MKVKTIKNILTSDNLQHEDDYFLKIQIKILRNIDHCINTKIIKINLRIINYVCE